MTQGIMSITYLNYLLLKTVNDSEEANKVLLLFDTVEIVISTANIILART